MQTSMNLYMGEGFAGMIVDNSPHTIDSYQTEAEIGFGYGAVAGSVISANRVSNGTIKPPATAGDTFRGVVIHNHREQAYPTANGATYAAYTSVPVMRKGKAFVLTSKAVTADTDAYLDPSTGKFTDSSSSTIATGGKFRKTTTAAGLSIIDINLP